MSATDAGGHRWGAPVGLHPRRVVEHVDPGAEPPVGPVVGRVAPSTPPAPATRTRRPPGPAAAASRQARSTRPAEPAPGAERRRSPASERPRADLGSRPEHPVSERVSDAERANRPPRPRGGLGPGQRGRPRRRSRVAGERRPRRGAWPSRRAATSISLLELGEVGEHHEVVAASSARTRRAPPPPARRSRAG